MCGIPGRIFTFVRSFSASLGSAIAGRRGAVGGWLFLGAVLVEKRDYFDSFFSLGREAYLDSISDS